VIVLLLALLGALTYIFWQNTHKASDAVSTQLQSSSSSSSNNSNDSSTTRPAYKDLRVNGKDATGVHIESAADVGAKLPGAGAKLQSYLKQHVGEKVQGITGDESVNTYIIDRVYGDYAAGSGDGQNAYVLWGPKNGSGDIAVVAATQGNGFDCTDLKQANVSPELVDKQCSGPNSSVDGGKVPYSL
jgi:hypothetical protein